MATPYGQELILDLHECDASLFNRHDLSMFFDGLCECIDMIPERLEFWDDQDVPPHERQTDPKTKGTSAVQFILTSSIVVHCLDLLGKVFINIFSCKEFDPVGAESYCVEFFKAECVHMVSVERD